MIDTVALVVILLAAVVEFVFEIEIKEKGGDAIKSEDRKQRAEGRIIR